MALGAGTLGLKQTSFLAKYSALLTDLIRPANVKLIMKSKLFIVLLFTAILSGCVVVPAHPYAYHPAERVYIY
jgi:hypothetical protein